MDSSDFRRSTTSDAINVISRPPDALVDALAANDVVAELFDTWATIALPDCWLIAGIVVQSYWNRAFDQPPLYGVSDVDLIYFDPNDLSEAAEADVALEVRERFAHVPLKFDVKNEARVHLWYESRFGIEIEPYTSSPNAIDTFPTTVGSMGVRPGSDGLEAYATFGFDDLLSLVVRPNKRQVTRDVYAAKVDRWLALWPDLNIVDWDDVDRDDAAVSSDP